MAGPLRAAPIKRHNGNFDHQKVRADAPASVVFRVARPPPSSPAAPAQCSPSVGQRCLLNCDLLREGTVRFFELLKVCSSTNSVCGTVLAIKIRCAHTDVPGEQPITCGIGRSDTSLARYPRGLHTSL
ncbi:hypothetical protein BD309DRAFT_963582 [Dichomitus squalens]|nr:hypothetical protein BD309DRAFT_963582 [Dichomitus squalens]